MSATTPETLRALEARLRQLFADLGVPADEAVELRADELAALLDTAPPALAREQAEAKLKERKGVGVDRPGPNSQRLVGPMSKRWPHF